MKTVWKHIFAALLLLLVMTAAVTPAFAASDGAAPAEAGEQAEDQGLGGKPWAPVSS